MSIVPKETVEVIAQSIGINSLSTDAALALAPDVEYRMREIMQEGIKCMHHSKRTTLTTDDIDSALSMRNVEPLYGFASGDPLRFKRALGHNDLFYLDDKEVDFKEVIEAPLPKAPLDTSLFCHWLAIEGVQPAIPENAPYEVIASLPETKKPEQKSDELPVDIRLPVKHVLSRELQLYFNKITELAVSMPDSILFKEALGSLATDSGIHPLVPYFTLFIEDEVSRGLNDFQLLFALMRLVWGLLQNPHIHVEPYLHQLMPSVVTCILAKKLGKRIADNHWELRDFAANLVAHICKRFGHNYTSLQTRLTTTLLKPFLDPKRSLPQHYGAVQGLAALGPHVVRLRILPNLETNLGILEEILRDNKKKEMTRHEAWRVYGALLRAAGRSIYDLLKLFPVLPSPPANSVWKTNSRVIGTSQTHKRKASPEELEQQPSPKKMMTDGPVVSPSSNNDMAIDAQGETAADAGETAAESGETAANNDMVIDVQAETAANSSEIAANAGKPEPETASARKQMSDNGGAKDTNGKREKGNSSRHALRTPAYLDQVWKDDLNSGQLVISLFELFGEGIMSFIPAPEMSLFL
ncbi:TATA BOX ASSOCIATED FACTOR II 59 [Artemisia annua]|uniref:TATA BOX ASSOCIATED FACTOR II 59 n=1 Tax=Artemisia annua TaxID=35608 RepID=A0A2U1M6F2_ARTAN|nr:TATA BOX ASSOCIATED FACTOR II 59 [Artemisia annua]